MATKRKTAKRAKRARKAPRKAARKASARRVVYVSRQPVARRKTSNRRTRRGIGSMAKRSSFMGKLGARLAGSLASGVGQVAGEMVTANIPLSRAAAGGIVAGGGLLVGAMMPKEGALASGADGLAGTGLRVAAMSLLAPGGVTGIGRRRRLTAAEIKMIEDAARNAEITGRSAAETLTGAQYRRRGL